MATFLPAQSQHQPLTNYALNTPPDPSLFYSNHALQQPTSANEDIHESNDPRAEYRPSLDFPPDAVAMTPNGNGAIQMPTGATSHMPTGGGRHRNTMSLGAFDGPRSPPSAKNTSHVPCKFFKLGQCQAGKACPFSHALDNTGDEICRYFQKVSSMSRRHYEGRLKNLGELQVWPEVRFGPCPPKRTARQ